MVLLYCPQALSCAREGKHGREERAAVRGGLQLRQGEGEGGGDGGGGRRGEV